MSEEVRHTSEPEFAALVAIDWADKKHVWRLEVIGTGQRERGGRDAGHRLVDGQGSGRAAAGAAHDQRVVRRVPGDLRPHCGELAEATGHRP